MEDKKTNVFAPIVVFEFLRSEDSKRHKLTPHQYSILMTFAHIIGKKSECWPSQEFLCSLTRISLASIKRALFGLLKEGLIKVRRVNKHNYYSLNIQSQLTMSCEDEIVIAHSEPYEPESQLTMSYMNPSHSSPRATNISIQANNSLKANKPLKFTDVNPCNFFEQFWDSYPRKQNKTKAQKVWKNKKLDKQLHIILEDLAKRKLDDHQWKTKQFIPLATTYLNGERWNDEIIKQEEVKNNNSSYKKIEVKSTVPDFQPTVPEKPKTEEELKISATIQEEEMVKIRRMAGITKHTRYGR